MNIKGIKIDNYLYDIKDAFGRAITAEEYNENESYLEGDLVQNNGLLYQCIGDTSGTWDSTMWSGVYLADLMNVRENEKEMECEDWDDLIWIIQSSYSKNYIGNDAEQIKGFTFYSCSSLTSVDFPNCTTIGDYAFGHCSNLTSVSFPNCTTIGNDAFYYCYKLTSVDFPNCTTIDHGAFYYCYKLTSVDFPNCTNIGSSAFCYCSSLTSVSFPNCTNIGSSAFYYCTSLTSLYLLSTSVCKLSNSNAFFNTPMSKSTYTGSFGSIYVPSSLINSYKTATNWTYYSDRITAYEGGN